MQQYNAKLKLDNSCFLVSHFRCSCDFEIKQLTFSISINSYFHAKSKRPHLNSFRNKSFFSKKQRTRNAVIIKIVYIPKLRFLVLVSVKNCNYISILFMQFNTELQETGKQYKNKQKTQIKRMKKKMKKEEEKDT